jgi:hypothetical protein
VIAGAASNSTAEFMLETRHGGLDEASPRVSGFSLPSESADTIDMLDVLISLVTVDACIVAGIRISHG